MTMTKKSLSSNKLFLNRILYPVTTLGYGNRIGIWFQGCSIGCPGCVSRDTWAKNTGRELTISKVVEICKPWLATCDGITFTGGEPLDQLENLIGLCRLLRQYHDGDHLLFTGYETAEVISKPIFDPGMVDILITGPFQPQAGHSKILRGSDNQEILLLSQRAHERYPENINDMTWQGPRKMDWFSFENQEVFAGIPEPHWGSKFRESLKTRGYECSTSDRDYFYQGGAGK
jgi:anaerobic ribonucleoside-triphosphate reductase activating protein